MSVNSNHLVPNVITWVSKDFRIEWNKFKKEFFTRAYIDS